VAASSAISSGSRKTPVGAGVASGVAWASAEERACEEGGDQDEDDERSADVLGRDACGGHGSISSR